MFGVGAKIFICCLVAAIASTALAAVPLVRRSNRVIGGVSVNITKRPYLAQLRDNGFGLFICGATIVDSTHVVTAAHCVTESDPVTSAVIVGGASTIFEDGVSRKIIACNIHPNYRKGHQYANDIAVLKLESPLEGPNIIPIGVSYDGIKDEEFVTISGWGKTEEGITGTVKLIRTTRVAKIPDDECRQKYANYSELTDTMICAATPGKDSCQGDSGGPAIYHGKLTAVVSWGKGCADPDYPGVYTALSVPTIKNFVSKYLKQ